MKTQMETTQPYTLDKAGMQQFTDAYIVAALWSSSDDAGDSLDTKYGVSDIAPHTMARMQADCAKFYITHWRLLFRYAEQAGHDFWLTRNGHGSGFWDRGVIYGEEAAKALTAACGLHTPFPPVDLYIGDDGKIYGA